MILTLIAVLIPALVIVLVLGLDQILIQTLIRCGAGRTNAWKRWLRSPGRKRSSLP